MPSIPELIFLTPPEHLRAVQAAGLSAAHLAYRVGGGPHLYRTEAPVAPRGGRMAMDCREAPFAGTAEPFCREVLRECSARGFQGVLALGARPGGLMGGVLAALEPLLARQGWTLYVPEACAGPGKSRVLLSSALSGGSLQARLEEAAERFGPERLVLRVERVAMDFTLPSPSGEGTPLSRGALAELLERERPSVFFSHELCARYFTYMGGKTGAHFVLFDDADSLRKKLELARRMGIRQAVLSYPQVSDLLGELLG